MSASRKTGKNSFDVTCEIVASMFSHFADGRPVDETTAKEIGDFYRSLLKEILKIKIDYENDTL